MRKLWLLLALPVIALDQRVKWWAAEEFRRSSCRGLIPGIELTYAENTGAAFSLLSGGGARWFLVAVSTLAAAAIVVAVCKRWIGSLFGIISVSCVLGGAVGNLIDRVLNGYVVDMFAFTFIDFAIFNVADVFITAGGACFVLASLLEGRKKNAPMDTNS
jgi:signal peptidase II